MIMSGGMQCASKSYNLFRISPSLVGDCSRSISSAMLSMYFSQSACFTSCFGSKGYIVTRAASRVRRALRRLPCACNASRSANSLGSVSASLRAVWCSTMAICSAEGAAMRTQRQRERMGAITRQALLHVIMMRQVVMYFSIVRRRACCASLERLSTSLSTTTLNGFQSLGSPDEEVGSGAEAAISLIISCTTSLSRLPASPGLSSMWCGLERMEISTVVLPTLNCL
mmetsp:Transcript_33805/g.84243  ORF Transcript_33805/g.84243 Transcript_33805/m.84243 type:complete len:227 (-) Transcript_33805:280-960(-)